MTTCPHLPETSAHYCSGTPPRPEGAAAQYSYRLRYAQSHLRQEKPAQALLQINHALAIDPPDHSLREITYPYQAIAWILKHYHSGLHFLGNPVRHYQHLATRIPPHKHQHLIRSQRAWICFHLSETILHASQYPRDQHQITTERIDIPSLESILTTPPISRRPVEISAVRQVIADYTQHPPQSPESTG